MNGQTEKHVGEHKSPSTSNENSADTLGFHSSSISRQRIKINTATDVRDRCVRASKVQKLSAR